VPELTVMRSRAIAVGVALTAAACAAYTPAPIEPEATLARLDQRSLSDPRLLAFVAAMAPELAAPTGSGHWSTAALTLAALYDHPDLAIDRASIEAADAAVTTAGEWANPSVTLAPTKHTSPMDPAWTVGAAIDLVLDSFGKREAREAAAREAAAAARQELVAAAWRVRDGVENALLALWTAEAKLEVETRRQSLQATLVSLLEAREANDRASGAEVVRGRIQLAEFDLAAATTANERDAARQALATAISIPVHALDGVALEFGDVDRREPEEIPAADTLRRQALTSRSDVLGALAHYREAESLLRLQVAQQFPDLHLQPSYAYQEQDNEYAFSLSAELPVFNQHQGPIAEAEARRRAAAARVLAVQAQAMGEVDAAFTGWIAASQALTAADALADAQAREEQRVEHSFAVGEADHVALIAARLDATASELARIEAVDNREEAADALEAALQQPLFDPNDSGFLKAAAATRAASL
jgi:outer membrane protein TolC